MSLQAAVLALVAVLLLSLSLAVSSPSFDAVDSRIAELQGQYAKLTAEIDNVTEAVADLSATISVLTADHDQIRSEFEARWRRKAITLRALYYPQVDFDAEGVYKSGVLVPEYLLYDFCDDGVRRRESEVLAEFMNENLRGRQKISDLLMKMQDKKDIGEQAQILAEHVKAELDIYLNMKLELISTKSEDDQDLLISQSSFPSC